MKFSEWLLVMLWVTGVVVAKGGWTTFFAIIFPPWAWYLVIENALNGLGWL